MQYRLNRQSLIVLVVLFSLMLLTAPAGSADVDVLTQNSQAILFGKAIDSKCEWAETSLNILTYTTFQVERVIKGDFRKGDTVTIQAYGGTINGMKQNVPNAASFEKGASALVFLNPVAKGTYYVNGDKEGVIHFVKKGGDQITQDGKGLSQMIKKVNLVLEK